MINKLNKMIRNVQREKSGKPKKKKAAKEKKKKPAGSKTSKKKESTPTEKEAEGKEKLEKAEKDGEEEEEEEAEAKGGEILPPETSSVPSRDADPRKWSAKDASIWLQEEGFGDHSETFLKNEVDGAALLNLDVLSLKELGVELVGTRIKCPSPLFWALMFRSPSFWTSLTFH